jgi:hypothetical protein
MLGLIVAEHVFDASPTPHLATDRRYAFAMRRL